MRICHPLHPCGKRPCIVTEHLLHEDSRPVHGILQRPLNASTSRERWAKASKSQAIQLIQFRQLKRFQIKSGRFVGHLNWFCWVRLPWSSMTSNHKLPKAFTLLLSAWWRYVSLHDPKQIGFIWVPRCSVSVIFWFVALFPDAQLPPVNPNYNPTFILQSSSIYIVFRLLHTDFLKNMKQMIIAKNRNIVCDFILIVQL